MVKLKPVKSSLAFKLWHPLVRPKVHPDAGWRIVWLACTWQGSKKPKSLFHFFKVFFSYIRVFLVIVACIGFKLWTIHIGCYLKGVLFNPLIFSLCVQGALNMWQYVTIWSQFMDDTCYSFCKHVWLLLSCNNKLIRPE